MVVGWFPTIMTLDNESWRRSMIHWLPGIMEPVRRRTDFVKTFIGTNKMTMSMPMSEAVKCASETKQITISDLVFCTH